MHTIDSTLSDISENIWKPEHPVYNLKVLLQGECVAILARGFVISLLRATHDAGFLVIRDALFEKICLSSKGDVLHDLY